MRRAVLAILAAGGVLAASPARAGDEAFELWLNPSVSTALDEDTGLELETAQRFRDADDGRPDTYFARLWLQQRLSEDFTLAGAVEQRFNDGGRDEFRVMQQLSGRHGLLRTRFRLEQRFVEDSGRMGLRFRPRLGVGLPLDEAGRWSFGADAELFVTIASTSAGGDDGITGLRTQVGVSYDVSDRLSLGLTYLRQQDFEDSGPDQIGHAPVLGIELAL